MQENTPIIFVSLFALLLRCCITYHSYSGQGKPPMFGDYEAQRHWQEITLNLPVEKWYINATDNDLQYWGLDYPPLTAYHSFALGYIADKINSSYTKLHESRGFSSEDHKFFMRLTVLWADLLVYMPSMISFALINQMPGDTVKEEYSIFGFKKKHVFLSIMLTYPGLILIDHGHFQYNCVSLGLFIGSVACMIKNFLIPGSILFVAALSYKQMELYHALPIFFYILGKYWPLKTKFQPSNLGMLLSVSLTVVIAFIIMWLPFLKNIETFTSVIFRLFPVTRGVFEDKVANIWCAINIVYKLQQSFTNNQLAKVCLVVTSFAVTPTCINLYLNPDRKRFIVSLINCALAFFLFSFQVHEKSILLVAIPVLLHFQNEPLSCFWFLIISHFSMLPLYIKDNLYLPYCATLVFYFCFVLWSYPNVFNFKESSNIVDSKQSTHLSNQRQIKKKLQSDTTELLFTKIKQNILDYFSLNYDTHFRTIIFYISILGVIILSIVSYFLKPPNKYPDLFALLVSVYSCGHFIIFYLYFNYKQFCT